MSENNSPMSPEDFDRIAAHAREGAERAVEEAANEAERRERKLTTDSGLAELACDVAVEEKKREKIGMWADPCHHEDFVWDAAAKAYRRIDTGTMICATTVNGLIPAAEWREYTHTTPTGQERVRRAKPSDDIPSVEWGRPVNGSTWWPGKPRFLLDCMPKTSGGIVEGKGGTMMNLYEAPRRLVNRCGVTAQKWLDHIEQIYPEHVDYLLDYFAHTLQFPGIKINHGIVLAGPQGCGKDTMLVPVRIALDEMDKGSVAPDDFFSRFNPFVQRVMIVIDEWRALDTEHSLVQAYNRLKVYTADPPAFHTMADKHEKGIPIPNVQRVVVTTNEPDSFYIDPDDRRWSMLATDVAAASFPEGYWAEFYRWGEDGGWAAVQQLLARRDVSRFDPKAPPPESDVKKMFVSQWSERVEDDALDIALRHLENMNGGERPKLIYGKELMAALEDEAMIGPEEKVVAEQNNWSEESTRSMDSLRAREFDARKKELRDLLKSKVKLAKRLRAEGYTVLPRPAGDAYWPTYGLPNRFQNRVLLCRKDYNPTPEELCKEAERRLRSAAERF